MVDCTADEKGKCHVRGAKHVITCPKVTGFGAVGINTSHLLQVVWLAGGLEPKTDSPPGLNVYKY